MRMLFTDSIKAREPHNAIIGIIYRTHKHNSSEALHTNIHLAITE